MGEIIAFDKMRLDRDSEDQKRRKAMEEDLIYELNEYRAIDKVNSDYLIHAQMLEDPSGEALYQAALSLRHTLWTTMEAIKDHLVNGDAETGDCRRFQALRTQCETTLHGIIESVREAARKENS